MYVGASRYLAPSAQWIYYWPRTASTLSQRFLCSSKHFPTSFKAKKQSFYSATRKEERYQAVRTQQIKESTDSAVPQADKHFFALLKRHFTWSEVTRPARLFLADIPLTSPILVINPTPRPCVRRSRTTRSARFTDAKPSRYSSSGGGWTGKTDCGGGELA